MAADGFSSRPPPGGRDAEGQFLKDFVQQEFFRIAQIVGFFDRERVFRNRQGAQGPQRFELILSFLISLRLSSVFPAGLPFSASLSPSADSSF